MIKYIVSISYLRFEFYNDVDAMEFAQKAIMTNKSDKTCEVEIELVRTKEDN